MGQNTLKPKISPRKPFKRFLSLCAKTSSSLSCEQSFHHLLLPMTEGTCRFGGAFFVESFEKPIKNPKCQPTSPTSPNSHQLPFFWLCFKDFCSFYSLLDCNCLWEAGNSQLQAHLDPLTVAISAATSSARDAHHFLLATKLRARKWLETYPIPGISSQVPNKM